MASILPMPGFRSAHRADAACPACAADDARASGDRIGCRSCGSIWMPTRRGFEYGDAYPADRGHQNAAVAVSKQATLASWLAKAGAPVRGRSVLEVGFGGGATLRWLREQGADAHGLEPVAANRKAALGFGLAPDRIAADMEAFHGKRFDLALYLDSFEHLLDPHAHLRALNRLTTSGSRALLVLPVADSLSRRVLRAWWPHDIADHWMFYSTAGLIALWRSFGWTLAHRFDPRKRLALRTIAGHWRMKTGMHVPLGPLADVAVWLNFGERGLVFERA